MRRTVLIVWVMGLFLMVSALMQAQSNVQPPSQAGYIAYIGPDSNVYTLNLSDYSSTQLTQDAGGHGGTNGPPGPRMVVWPISAHTWKTMRC